MHSGVCLVDKNRRAALARLRLEGISSLDAASAAIGHGGARTAAASSKQPLMVRTFLKVYMELGSYFNSARTNKRHHHHPRPGLFDQAGSSPVPAGSSFPRLHPAIGSEEVEVRLRRFSPLFSGFLRPSPVLLDTRCNSCSKGSPRRTPRGRPRTKGHMHSEGRIICRASRHLLRRATSFQRPIPTPSQLTFSSSGYFLFWKEKLFPLISEPLCAVYSEGS
jgi:hypothetical protein